MCLSRSVGFLGSAGAVFLAMCADISGSGLSAAHDWPRGMEPEVPAGAGVTVRGEGRNVERDGTGGQGRRGE